MSRTYTSGSLVALPRMSALTTARLLQELIGAAKNEKKLPAAIAADQAELEEAYATLHLELSRRISAEGEAPAVVRAADQVEDTAFGALFGWLSGWARLPVDKHPEAAEAATVLQTLFPDRLSFLSIRPEDEWQEAELRLQMISDKGFDTIINKLGGKPFLKELTQAHEAYGKALGITSPKAQAETPALREARNAGMEAIRDYVLRVSAHVRKKQPETAAMAERLLAPLTTFRDRPTHPAAEAKSPKAPATPPPDAPTP